MKKKQSIFFLIFFIIFGQKAFSNINKETNYVLGCNNPVNQQYLRNIDNLKIKKIEIDIHDYKRWMVNSIRIITSPSRFTADKYKRRFNSTLVVTYEDNTRCVFEGRIRHSGDEKDHINISGNTILQSLDIHLTNGNIRGITKFKLLKPNTRGNLEDEILLTEMLRNLNYLAPRTIKVDARINEATSIMIFQEKAAKELLEFNNRREGPILEGDERFFFKKVESLPDNQLSNWSVGVVPLMNESIKHMLTKQVNSRIIHKSNEHKKMSFNSLTKLNLIYLNFSNKFQNEKNKFNYFDYDLDNTLLGMFDSKNILKLDAYNLLMQATNSHHGLAPNNRKFYWNSIESYFEPINYDSNPNIDKESPVATAAIYRLPISNQFFNAFDYLNNNLKNLDLIKFHKNISSQGLNLSLSDLNLKIDKILHNLDKIKTNYSEKTTSELIEYNKFKSFDNILARFNKTLREVDPNVYLVRHTQDDNQLQRCKIFLQKCENHSFSAENLSELLEGELVLNNTAYQYIGESLDFKNIIEDKSFKKINFKKTTIAYDENIEIKETSNGSQLDIYQKAPGARVYIINGEIENLKINFYGHKINENELNLKNFPVDINGLTGCLSIINLKVKNISINAADSTCEDTVNFINVAGSINEVNIKNSYSDGLDVDFSNLQIDNIEIELSKNDCVDFSAGDYKINNLNLKKCGDKALSVGEKSFLTLNTITAENADIGIASKDSSIVKLNNAYLKNLKTCVAAYNKKQEFNGGFIEMQNMKCKNYYKKANIDVHSKILNKNEF